MTTEEKTPLLLLKTKSDPEDPYEEFFTRDNRFNPVFVPVLKHTYHDSNILSLSNQITSGRFRAQESNDYGGLVFTSQRAVEAFASVLKQLREIGQRPEELFDPSLPFYVVGPATAKSIRNLGLPCQVLGEESGNGDILADFIVSEHRQPRDRRLLFLVGEQRRDIIPTTLQSRALPREKRIRVEELTVYETNELSTFKDHFLRELADAKLQNPERQWVVVFSPTGCRAMLEAIGLLSESRGMTEMEAEVKDQATKVATIGPTTKTHLEKSFGFDPDACADVPSPEGLMACLMEVPQTKLSRVKSKLRRAVQ